jgi:hypothetical protein
VSAALAQEGAYSPAKSRVLADSQGALPGLVGASDLPRAFAGPRIFTQNDNHDDEGMGLTLDYIASGLRAEGIFEKNIRAAVDFLVEKKKDASSPPSTTATTNPRREEKAQHAKKTPPCDEMRPTDEKFEWRCKGLVGLGWIFRLPGLRFILRSL